MSPNQLNIICIWKNKYSRYLQLHQDDIQHCEEFSMIPAVHWREVQAAFPPYLHSFAPGAHVLAQEQVIERDGPDDVEHLLDHLLDQLWVHPVLAHDRVEGVQLPDDGVQGVGALISNAGCSLPQPCWFHPWDSLDGLVLQHSWNCISLTPSLQWLKTPDTSTLWKTAKQAGLSASHSLPWFPAIVSHCVLQNLSSQGFYKDYSMCVWKDSLNLAQESTFLLPGSYEHQSVSWELFHSS